MKGRLRNRGFPTETPKKLGVSKIEIQNPRGNDHFSYQSASFGSFWGIAMFRQTPVLLCFFHRGNHICGFPAGNPSPFNRKRSWLMFLFPAEDVQDAIDK
jgi:hypothetical protein